MYLTEVVKKWKIDLPENEWYFDYFYERYRSRVGYIDRFPKAVPQELAYKFDQVDISFQEVLNHNVHKDEFQLVESKFRNVLTKLWVYSNVYIDTNVGIQINKKSKKYIDKQYKGFVSLLNDTHTHMPVIEKKEEMEFWVQVSLRDLIQPIFYFEEFEILITPMWSCFMVFFKDSNNMQKVKEIVDSEGLFLRMALGKSS